MPWTETEFSTIDLGDKRNNARAIKIAKAIEPQSSIPQSCQDWAETIGTYRFYANESFTSNSEHYNKTTQIE
jgi:hypothetical protein